MYNHLLLLLAQLSLQFMDVVIPFLQYFNRYLSLYPGCGAPRGSLHARSLKSNIPQPSFGCSSYSVQFGCKLTGSCHRCKLSQQPLPSLGKVVPSSLRRRILRWCMGRCTPRSARLRLPQQRDHWVSLGYHFHPYTECHFL